MGQESAGDPEQDGGGAESLPGGEPALGSGRGGRRGDGRLVVGGRRGGGRGGGRDTILSMSIRKHFRWGGVTLLPESTLDQFKDI